MLVQKKRTGVHKEKTLSCKNFMTPVRVSLNPGPEPLIGCFRL